MVQRAFFSEPSGIFQRKLRRNRTLFSLGVVLIELWYWKCLKDYELKPKPRDAFDSGWTDLERADAIIDDLYEDALPKYCDVVRRCISGLDHREISLAKDDFKEEVHLKVFCPLEELSMVESCHRCVDYRYCTFTERYPSTDINERGLCVSKLVSYPPNGDWPTYFDPIAYVESRNRKA